MRFVFLTFDVEDFINDRSLRALTQILKLLKKYNMRSLFFISGHMAEKLGKRPAILNLFENHEVGYHSSAHSVRPIIPEFTDIRSYSRAVEKSLKIETSHINPLTGDPDGEGGIKILREILNNKDIVSFRAPGLCWTPPHLEALLKLGVTFDFSARLFGTRLPPDDVIAFKGITFYPFPIRIDFISVRQIPYIFHLVLKRKIACLISHECSFVNLEPWDSIFWHSNPDVLTEVPPRKDREIAINFMKLDMVLRGLKVLEKSRVIRIMSNLEECRTKRLNTRTFDVVKTYLFSMRWARRVFNYQPKHVFSHFHEFFG